MHWLVYSAIEITFSYVHFHSRQLKINRCTVFQHCTVKCVLICMDGRQGQGVDFKCRGEAMKDITVSPDRIMVSQPIDHSSKLSRRCISVEGY